jgi:hypothetical protein
LAQTTPDTAALEFARVQTAIDAPGFDPDHQWEKVLYYATNMWGIERSMVDDLAFFLSPNGKYNPKEELHATVTAMFAPAPTDPEEQNKHARCHFPRRESWIIQKTGLNPDVLPKVNCSWFEKWMKGQDYDAASLIFSSSYPNNPSSLFGHTFLRLHRKQSTGIHGHDLLDGAINFSAYPDTSNPVLYTLKGTAGGFPGRFSFTPYYLKVQEYSNTESRDLWEYRLTLSEVDIKNMIAAGWEMGLHHINYYYFDENCSEVILHFLQAVRPDLTLTWFKVWVIPSDTVRAVTNTPGLTKGFEYRASALTRFLDKYHKLSDSDRSLVDEITHDNSVPDAMAKLAKLPSDEEARVNDTLIEYIDYDEKLSGTKTAVTFSALRPALLLRRTKLPVLVEADIKPPLADQPDTGHETARVRFGGGALNRTSPFVEAEWRPALHDHMSSNQGYAAGLGIDFFDLNLRYLTKEKRALVDSWALIRILSLPELDAIVRRPAWNLSLGTEADYTCAGKSHETLDYCYRSAIKGGVGLSYPIKPLGLMIFGMANMAIGHNTGLKRHWFAEPSLMGGVTFAPRENLKFEVSVGTAYMAPYRQKGIRYHTLDAHVASALKRNHELRLDGKRSTLGLSETSLGYLYYF